MFLYVFLGPVWLYCVSAWGWLLAKCGGKSGVLVFAFWPNLGGFNPLCSWDTWLVLRFRSCRRASLGVGLCVQPPVHFQELWRKCPETFPVTLQGQSSDSKCLCWRLCDPPLVQGKGSNSCDLNPSEQVGWVLDWAFQVDSGDEGLSRNPELYSALLYLNVLKIEVLFRICF